MHFDIAISFAGEDRSTAEKIANMLKDHGLIVFFDDDQQAELLGENLYEYLIDVYKNRASYCVVLISQYYLNKRWTRHEWSAAQARAFEQFDKSYILPIRLDDTNLPGLLPTTGFLSLSNMSLKEVCEKISAKVANSASLNHIHNIAIAAFNRGDLNRVCELLDNLTLKTELSKNHAAYRLLADVKLMKGDIEEALTLFKEIVSIFSTDAEAWFQLGVCLTRLRKYSEAKTAYEKTLTLAPNHRTAMSDLIIVKRIISIHKIPFVGRFIHAVYGKFL